MLIDTSQKGNVFIASYANEEGGISLKEFDVRATNGIGMYDYEICDESDPDKEPILRHFKDNLPIRKKSSWKFDFDEQREFLLKQIPQKDHDDIFAYRVPDMFMADIEINILDGSIFPDAQKAEYPIDSIQITSPDLRTVTLSCNNRVLQDEEQILEIENAINEFYKDTEYVWEKTDRLRYSHIRFDTEKEMLEFFWKMVNEKIHSIAFWNGTRFDVPYLWNRCPKLGVDMALGSPTGEISQFNNWPKHRYVFDYLEIVAKWAWDLWPLLNLRLDYVVNKIFGIGKYQYEGSYKDLYNGPINNFMIYGAVDVISMQLMHLKKKYTVSKESLVFYTKTGLFDASKVTSQVHALIWDELYEKNMINAEPYEKKIKTAYEGGYVKTPVRKFAMFPVCVDFSALYPRVIQSHNISFENYVGKIKSKAHGDELTAQGYYVSVNGNYYKNDRDYTLKLLETKLLKERYDYKELMSETFLKALPPIEAEMAKRGLKIPK